ncbi:hypothetical protein BaRGS_00003533 [Batillaria attramentaria]|uniref:Uncharacterized protein n=1 Tax=Batillaria attramentaria TaxID=370345 RepID=A0ABD0M1K7_9CAEN
MSADDSSVVHHAKAASEDLSYLRMEEDLTCPVCLELYADPLMLPCSHSVCKKCLADIHSSRTRAGKEGLECPSCRRHHGLSDDKVDHLPRNLALENIVFRFQELQSTSLSKSKSFDLTAISPHSFDHSLPADPDLPVFAEEGGEESWCGMCEDVQEKAIWYCQQCSVLYCQQCRETYHPPRGSLRHHSLGAPPKGEEVHSGDESIHYCTDHVDEATAMFCGDCSQLVCPLCVCEGTGQHAGHKIFDLSTAWTQMKATVGDFKDRLQKMMSESSERCSQIEQLIQELEALHKGASEKIELQCDRLLKDVTDVLMAHKRNSLKQLHSVHASRLTAYQSHAAVIHDQTQQLEGLVQRCTELLGEEEKLRMLQNAGESPSLAEQLKEVETQHDALGTTQKQLCSDRDALCKLRSSLSEFQSSVYKLLHTFSGDTTGAGTVITPAIRSVMLTSPGKTDAQHAGLNSQNLPPTPRSSNRTLISWGFNFTTFTAEPLTHSAQWSISVEKNMSKIGNIDSGYLFGVGVAREVLNSKDQVGMTASSAGIICSNGCLAFCQDSKMDSILTLDQLPVSITLYLSLDAGAGVVLSYLLSTAGWSRCLLGKTVLSEPGYKVKVHPVFTVSQRVKLQFVSCSSV